MIPSENFADCDCLSIAFKGLWIITSRKVYSILAQCTLNASKLLRHVCFHVPIPRCFNDQHMKGKDGMWICAFNQMHSNALKGIPINGSIKRVESNTCSLGANEVDAALEQLKHDRPLAECIALCDCLHAAGQHFTSQRGVQSQHATCLATALIEPWSRASLSIALTAHSSAPAQDAA